jgi:hypothetical protein
MARSSLRCLLMQLSPLTHTSLEAFSLPPCVRFHCSAVSGGCDGLWSFLQQASPIARRLANLRHRIEFTFVWDCPFAPGCFPSRLATTQLPFASPPFPGSVAIRFSLIGLYVVMITRTPTSPSALSTLPTRTSAFPGYSLLHFGITPRFRQIPGKKTCDTIDSLHSMYFVFTKSSLIKSYTCRTD